jgi:hypothetical protein
MDLQQNTPEMEPQVAYDMVELPSKGVFYPGNKKSVKVSYLTAEDENILTAPNLVQSGEMMDILLGKKILDKDIDIATLAECDRQAVLIFLRNTAFGSEYTFNLVDPITNESFEHIEDLSNLTFKEVKISPNKKGEYETTLPKSGRKVMLKTLSPKDEQELNDLRKAYENIKIPPSVTKRIEKMVVEIDGIRDVGEIARTVSQLPIADSKYIRKFIADAEPGLDLRREVVSPAGNAVSFQINFGVEFFRPFFGV